MTRQDFVNGLQQKLTDLKNGTTFAINGAKQEAINDAHGYADGTREQAIGAAAGLVDELRQDVLSGFNPPPPPGP